MLNRRTLLFAAAAVASKLGTNAMAQPAQRVRYKASTPEGKAMLRIYASAVAAMKKRSAQDGRSWTFQWYVHASPDDKNVALHRVFDTATGPARDLASATWWTCQSHSGQPEDYFLPWHRLYLMYFENIVRTISGRADFTLPYWDYTSPDSYAIPEEFQAKNQTDPGPWRVVRRQPEHGRRLSAFGGRERGRPAQQVFRGRSQFSDTTGPR